MHSRLIYNSLLMKYENIQLIVFNQKSFFFSDLWKNFRWKKQKFFLVEPDILKKNILGKIPTKWWDEVWSYDS